MRIFYEIQFFKKAKVTNDRSLGQHHVILSHVIMPAKRVMK